MKTVSAKLNLVQYSCTDSTVNIKVKLKVGSDVCTNHCTYNYETNAYALETQLEDMIEKYQVRSVFEKTLGLAYAKQGQGQYGINWYYKFNVEIESE